ncbi:MAG: hypothetical protein JRD71_10035 [Deltaproteobacteria bacterium]|nr:hypothetical protein [Deltaproteobacteria bacterium]
MNNELFNALIVLQVLANRRVQSAFIAAAITKGDFSFTLDDVQPFHPG